MTEKRDAKVFVITEAKDLTKLTYEELISILLTYESMISKPKRTKKYIYNLTLVSTSEEGVSNITDQMVLMLKNIRKCYKKLKTGGKTKCW